MYIRGATANFNSRPSARGDAGRECRCTASILYFNSRPSARGDQADDMRARLYAISIHAPPRGATRHSCRTVAAHTFQFTPLREGRRLGVVLHMRDLLFSIHAPPRGATLARRSWHRAGNFQFTPLREGRHGREHYFITQSLSIHAPPRGATEKAGRAA